MYIVAYETDKVAVKMNTETCERDKRVDEMYIVVCETDKAYA